MSEAVERLAPADQTWSRMRVEAATAAAQEPILASFLNATVLNHETFPAALSYRLAQKLGDTDMNAMSLREACDKAYASDPEMPDAALADILAVFDRDPACRGYLQPFLYFKGYLALQGYRVAHHLWNTGRTTLALYLQSRISELFSVDIHPAATIGKGVFIDHATGIVIGETTVVGDDVSLMQDVTLGGTGNENGDRHPKIARGVLIGAGARVLGNIEIGAGARIAAGSVVLKPVPAKCTVAGVPAKPVGGPCCDNPALSMDQQIDV
ncbi:MAG: serine O-acetyltransferase [Pseudomonadota bacterium]